MKILEKTVLSSVAGIVAFAMMLFVPAGTLDYWQAWVFLGTFTLATVIFTAYLLRANPAALERRMHAGPLAEIRPLQRIASSVLFVAFPAMFVVSALDHRFHWSPVPTLLSILGDVLVTAGLGVAMLVVVQNGYAAANIVVESSQPVVSTGWYGLVRHPMYTGALVMMLGVPLALDSYIAVVLVLPGLVAVVVRIRDEEDALEHELNGYRTYMQKVHYRLLPRVW